MFKVLDLTQTIDKGIADLNLPPGILKQYLSLIRFYFLYVKFESIV